MKIVKLISLITFLTVAPIIYGMDEALVKFSSATEAAQKSAIYDEILSRVATASVEELTQLCGILNLPADAFDFEKPAALVTAKRTLVAKTKSAKTALGRVATSSAGAADSVEATQKAVAEIKAKLNKLDARLTALGELQATTQESLAERDEEAVSLRAERDSLLREIKNLRQMVELYKGAFGEK